MPPRQLRCRNGSNGTLNVILSICASVHMTRKNMVMSIFGRYEGFVHQQRADGPLPTPVPAFEQYTSISAATAAAAPGSRSLTTSRAPPAASLRAIARPIPVTAAGDHDAGSAHDRHDRHHSPARFGF